MISVFLIASFICASYTVYQSTTQLNRLIKQQLGANVYLKSDIYNFIVINKSLPEYETVHLKALQAVEELKEYLNDERVLYGDFFQALPPTHEFYLEHNLLALQKDGSYFGLLGEMSDLQLISVSQTPMIDVLEKEFRIIEGREFNQQELQDGSMSILLSDRFVKKDGSPYHAGETISIEFLTKKSNLETQETKTVHRERFDFEVIGIYHPNFVKDSTKIIEKNVNYSVYCDDPYIPYQTLKKIGERIKEVDSLYGEGVTSYGDIALINGFFRLKNPDDVESFISDLNQSVRQYVGFYLVSSLDDYYAVSDPINKLKLISLFIILFALLAAVILLSLILNYYVKSRKKEIGLYLSLGEKRKKILFQVFCEICLICLISLSTAIYTGNKIGKNLTNEMIHDTLKVDEKIEEEMIIENYQSKLDLKYSMIMMIGGSIVILMASVYPITKMMKISPKELLS